MKIKFMIKISYVLLLSTFSYLANASFMFSATLEGEQEVPSIVTTASGMAMGELSGMSGSYVFNYQIDYMDLSSPIIDIAGGGHFHNAPLGANGGVIHLFDTDTFTFLGTTSGSIMGDWRFDDVTNPLTDALAEQLMAGNVYINLHTQNFNGGELRGQLTVMPEPATWFLFVTGMLFVMSRNKRGC
ncbi:MULTISPECIES: CHRD domain-containing protein [Aliiglaciecola]|uniref:CHRD domain-containing protein n=1 Tax=Aliiglaciecola TaxID=1406885 RepID=UPI001C09284C|nr:CHRD domain-containing protein [Aliiglaciecola lipolytica]MBU2878057.1 CHRD domain-containing protein [Aliiglaciecola lipolytica]